MYCVFFIVFFWDISTLIESSNVHSSLSQSSYNFSFSVPSYERKAMKELRKLDKRILYRVVLKYDTTLGVFFAQKQWKSLCKHGSLDTLSLSYGLFYFGKRRIKVKCKPSHRKVFIYKFLTAALQITILTKNYKKWWKCCACVST